VDGERSCRQPPLSIRGVQPPRVRGIWTDTRKQVSPMGRVQGPSRELETDSRNYIGYFLRYKPLAAPYPFIAPFTAIRPIRDSWFVSPTKGDKSFGRTRGFTRSRVQAYVLYYVHAHTHVYLRGWQEKGRPGTTSWDILAGWEKKLGISRFRWPFEDWLRV